jgi:hypothetical protein
MSTEENIINKGISAETLLKDTTFTSVLNELSNYYLQLIIQSAPEATKERDCAYFALKALQDVVALLNQQVGMRIQTEQAIKEAQEANESE